MRLSKLKLSPVEEKKPVPEENPLPHDIYVPSDEELDIMEGKREANVYQEESEEEFFKRMEQFSPPPIDDWEINDADIPPVQEEPDYMDAPFDDSGAFPTYEEDYYMPEPPSAPVPAPKGTSHAEPKEPVSEPAKAKKDDDLILIEPEMLTGRKTYAIKEDCIDALLDKIFERLDIPVIEYKAEAEKVQEIIVSTGGDLPTSLEMVTKDGTIDVPLGEHEQEFLAESIEIKDKENDKEK